VERYWDNRSSEKPGKKEVESRRQIFLVVNPKETALFYLMGVNHIAQSKKPGEALTPDQLSFRNNLRALIQKVGPVLVAEEDSEWALSERNEESIAKEIAKGKAEHRFCDPNNDQRKAMGYKTRRDLKLEIFKSSWDNLSDEEMDARGGAIELSKYFPLRERFWLKCIESFKDKDVIFVCGEAHVDRFKDLLESESIPCAIAVRGIGVTEKDRHDMKIAEDYLAQHPDVTDD
jgi:hypothetical protein